MDILSIDDFLAKQQIYEIWTDGSANLNVSAGFGYVITHNDKIINQGYGTVSDHFTAPHAELIAIMEAFKACMKLINGIFPIINVYSDNEYCVKTINIWGPTRKDWSKSAHTEKWLTLLKFINDYRKYSPITVKHVRGHSGLRYNELADKLAKQGNIKLK